MNETWNKQRIEKLSQLGSARIPDFLGCACLIDGVEGRIDAVYIDLQSAIDVGLVDEGWLESQDQKPRTSKDERWYSVVLPHGAVLVGARELVLP